MPRTEECIKERSTITTLNTLNDKSISYSTKYHGIKILEPQSLTTRVKLIHKELNSNTTATCISPDANLLAFANSNIIHILNIHTKEIIKSIKTVSEKITMLSFCANSTYIIAGSLGARIYQYRYDNSAILSRLCSFPYMQKYTPSSYISALSIYKNKLACSGSGGAIFVIDLLAQTDKKVLLKKGPRVDALCFINDTCIISGNVNGKIQIHLIDEDNKIKSIDAPFTNIRQIIKMPNSSYIMISSDTNYVAIADINKAKIIHAKYAEFEAPITNITLASDESVLVSLVNYKIINLMIDSPQKLKSLIIHNSLLEAYKLIKDEPMLHNTKEYQLLDKQYQHIYKDALHALINQNKNLAKNIMSIFDGVSSKEKEINDLFLAFDNYDRFKILYLEKKHALAYAISKKHPALQQTPLYINLEERFKESYINALRHIRLGKHEHAVAILHEYKTVISKHEIIRLLLEKNSTFFSFLEAIEKKDYQTIEELEVKNKVFTQTPTYVSLKQSMKKTINTIDSLIKEGELTKAKGLLSNLKNSSHINKELSRIHNNLNTTQELLNAYEINDFKNCYELLDTYQHLNSSHLGILLNKHWAKLISESEEYALRGDAKGIKKTLDELMHVSTRKNKIGDLLRVSFHSKIKGSLANKYFRNAENIIYSYIDIFGTDKEIQSLMKAYEYMCNKTLAITQDQETKVDRDQWRNSEILMQGFS